MAFVCGRRTTDDRPQQAQQHRCGLWSVVCGLSILLLPAGVWAADLTFSAKVDKTTVNLGDPIQLTLTFGGDTEGVELPKPEFPEGFAVAARSQSTNFSIRAGAMERSMSLLYVLIPQRAGTFPLGPFRLIHNKQTIQTEPIEVTVEKGVLPKQLQPHGERFTL